MKSTQTTSLAFTCISKTHNIFIMGQTRRTTLNLDKDALAGAMKVSPGKTRTAVINDALRDYARRRRLRGLLEHEGKFQWEGDLGELRKRAPRQ
jgi:Arc/MetJ family transcription regulator